MNDNIIYVIFFSSLLGLSIFSLISCNFGFNQEAFGVLLSNSSAQNSKQFFQSADNEIKMNFNEFDTAYSEWKQGKIDNVTLIKKTDNYTVVLENISKKMENFSPSNQYASIFQLYLKSLNNEINSNKHFIKYLQTGNTTENTIAEDLLSKVAEYEIQAIAEFNKLNPGTMN